MNVLFDVDGVLVHPWRFRDYLAREHGITPEMTQPFFQGPFTRCALGSSDLADELPRFLNDWGWPGTLEDFVEAWLVEENAPDERVLDHAAELRSTGVRCHVASTQEPRRARYLAHDMGFAERFDALLFSCDLGAAKPSADFFRRAQDHLGRAPTDLVLIDDAMANVEGARALGWQAIHYQGPESLAELLAPLARGGPR